MAGGAENAGEGAVSRAGPDGGSLLLEHISFTCYFQSVSALVLIPCTF